jgi:hypothetical protein
VMVKRKISSSCWGSGVEMGFSAIATPSFFIRE